MRFLTIRSFLKLLVCSAALPAASANIVRVTDQGTLNPNDQVAWSTTTLGPDGTSVNTLSGTSTLGDTIGGSLVGSGLVCDPNNQGACNVYPFSDNNVNIWTQLGGGPLTLTFPAVSGVGTFLAGDTNPGTPFSASLALYNGATLLGTVTETSDSIGDPIYLGATDTDGANITSAVYSLLVAGQFKGPVVGYTYVGYDCSGGHTDVNPLCPSLPGSGCTIPNNTLQCPQKCLCQGNSHAALPITSTHMPA